LAGFISHQLLVKRRRPARRVSFYLSYLLKSALFSLDLFFQQIEHYFPLPTGLHVGDASFQTSRIFLLAPFFLHPYFCLLFFDKVFSPESSPVAFGVLFNLKSVSTFIAIR